MANENLDLFVRVLSPLHIGGEQEKHLKLGFDFIYEDGQIHIIDQNALRERVGLDTYISALEAGPSGLVRLLRDRRVAYDTISHVSYPLESGPDDLKTMIREGMSGRAFLPGSSLKGALASVLFAKFYDGNRSQDRREVGGRLDSRVLGKFDNAFTRFLQVGDTYFQSDTTVQLAKVFNLRKDGDQWIGGWKHARRGGTNSTFDVSSFTTAFEVVQPESVAPLQLRFRSADMSMYQQRARSNGKGLNPIPRKAYEWHMEDTETGFRQDFFELIYHHTSTYLQKEIAFFQTYDVPETDKILEELRRLQNENTVRRPILRVGSGSGFHSVTGDWQYEDHLEPIQQGESRKLYKTRRLVFEQLTDGSYSFQPMGFIQFLTKEDYEENLLEELERRRAELAAREAAAREAAARAEAERLAAEQAALQPKMSKYSAGKLKRGVEIDGVVTGNEKNNIIVQPYLEGYLDERLPLRYAAEVPEGTTVRVKATLEGKRLRLYGAPKIKS